MLLFIHVEVFKTKRRVVETDKWKRRRGKKCIKRSVFFGPRFEWH